MVDSDPVDVNDDLDAFSDEFFGKSVDEPEAETPEDEEVKEDTPSDEGADEAEESVDQEDAPAVEDEDPDESEDDESEEEEEEEPAPKSKGRKSARERINELTAKARQAERELNDLRRRLEEREESEESEAPARKEQALSSDTPDPDGVAEDGSQIYPLGEFDPKYIRDLTRFTILEETAEAKRVAAEERDRELRDTAERELLTTWESKVEESLDELPDLREKALELEEVFTTVEPQYGQYIAMTIMSMDYGPHVLDYLADHPAEARKIIAAGPTQATIALGRLEAKFIMAKERDEKREVKQTNAPAPPPRNKGSSGRASVSDDTDDLDAFEKKFFKN